MGLCGGDRCINGLIGRCEHSPRGVHRRVGRDGGQDVELVVCVEFDGIALHHDQWDARLACSHTHRVGGSAGTVRTSDGNHERILLVGSHGIGSQCQRRSFLFGQQ